MAGNWLTMDSLAFSNNKPSTASPSRPKKRVITAARREQNKAAQRAWRERQKAHRNQSAKEREVRQIAPRPFIGPETPASIDESTAQAGEASDSYSEEKAISSPDSMESVPPANLLKNKLEIDRDTIWRAVFTNAISLGFDIVQLMDCQTNYTSPFYRSINPIDRPRDLVASALNPSFPLHLRPTMAQILIPHHASLDLIPIPLLRERVIMMSFAHPEEFSLLDFKQDIYGRRALFCQCEGPDGSYQPWDSRRWRMQLWFLKKWKLTSHESLPHSLDFGPVESVG